MPDNETLMIGEILAKVDSARSKQAKIKILEQYKSIPVLQHFLRGLFDPKIKWAITETPDYAEDDITPEGEEANSLYIEIPKCSLFVKDHPKAKGVKPIRLKQILVQVLESLHPSEASLYMQMLKKKTKVKGLTSKLVLEVFPGMYKEGV
jgi:hypothetical protein